MQEICYEEFLHRLISLRRTFDTAAERESRRRWDNIGKPIDGLGLLEGMISKIAGMTGRYDPDVGRKAVVVMCADNGVVAEGVAQAGQEVTALVAENIAAGISVVCLMAQTSGADVFAVDTGMASDVPDRLKTPAEPSCLLEKMSEKEFFSGFAGMEKKEKEYEIGIGKPVDSLKDVNERELYECLPPSGRLAKGKIASKKIAAGTENISIRPAMTRQQAALTVCRGIETAKELYEMGYKIVAAGEMGIGNTTTASAAACCLTGMAPEYITGRGAGLSGKGFDKKLKAVRRALEIHNPDPADALDILSKVGGFDMAAMTGLYLGGAIFGMPVVIDGVISAVSAVLAERLCPSCRNFMLASHLGKEPAMAPLLEFLNLEPVIHAKFALGEGTGAVALFPLIDMADNVYHKNITFEAMNMEAYQRME